MDAMKLVKPDETHAAAARALARDFALRGETAWGGSGIERMADYAQWLAKCRANEDANALPPGLMPSEQFFIVRAKDGAIVGVVKVRKKLNEQFAQTIGHVGYSVRFSERRKGYATRALSLAVRYLLDSGVEEVLVACERGNTASRRTIERCGGAFLNTVKVDGDTLLRYAIRPAKK